MKRRKVAFCLNSSSFQQFSVFMNDSLQYLQVLVLSTLAESNLRKLTKI